MLGYLVTANPKKLKKHKKHKPRDSRKRKDTVKKKKKRNPGGLLAKLKISSITSTVKRGAGIAVGALAAGIVAQNVIPSKYRDGVMGSVLTAAAAIGASMLAGQVSMLRPYAGDIAVGGVAAAILGAVSDKVLEATQFNLLGELDQRLILTSRRDLNGVDNRMIPSQASVMQRRMALAGHM